MGPIFYEVLLRLYGLDPMTQSEDANQSKDGQLKGNNGNGVEGRNESYLW